MSATLHAEMFSAYFGGCPALNIAGMAFPVQEYYLEHILRKTGFNAGRNFANVASPSTSAVDSMPSEELVEQWLADEADAVRLVVMYECIH